MVTRVLAFLKELCPAASASTPKALSKAAILRDRARRGLRVWRLVDKRVLPLIPNITGGGDLQSSSIADPGADGLELGLPGRVLYRSASGA